MITLLSANTKDWLVPLLIIIAALLVIYVVAAIATSGSIIVSKLVTANSISDGDFYYYLPAASISVKATAKVVVTKSTADNIIQSAALLEIAFENTVRLIPDKEQLFTLNYMPSIFMNDELKLNIDSSGLLTSISATTEDRISNIITTITAASGKILSVSEENAPEKITTQTILYTNDFFILSGEIKSGNAAREWTINIDGDTNSTATRTVNAAFSISFSPYASSKTFTDDEKKKYFKTVLVRPLQNVVITFSTTGNTNKLEAKYEALLPDTSCVIAVPIKRSAFVKKINIPKFSSGVLLENYINKPSEAEGFLSIPIDILKALFSIPAQLLTFKINNIKQQTSLTTEEQNLSNVLLQAKKNAITEDTELLKAKTEANKAAIESEKDIVTANKELINAKKDLETAKNDLNELLKKIEKAKTEKPAGS